MRRISMDITGRKSEKKVSTAQTFLHRHVDVYHNISHHSNKHQCGFFFSQHGGISLNLHDPLTSQSPYFSQIYKHNAVPALCDL